MLSLREFGLDGCEVLRRVWKRSEEVRDLKKRLIVLVGFEFAGDLEELEEIVKYLMKDERVYELGVAVRGVKE